jgi:hypothetical protein
MTLRSQFLKAGTSSVAAEGSAVSSASTHEPGHRAPIDVGRRAVLYARATVKHGLYPCGSQRGARTEDYADGLWHRPGLRP